MWLWDVVEQLIRKNGSVQAWLVGCGGFRRSSKDLARSFGLPSPLAQLVAQRNPDGRRR